MLEYIILISSWIITAVLLWRLVPRNKIRQAHVSFLFMQVITWATGLLVVQLGMIEYPIRFFPYASRASFTFEYFVYPALSVFFNIFYPEKKHWVRQVLHYILHASGITLLEGILLFNTRLIRYPKWTLYWTWITLVITFFLCRKYYEWFFKERKTDRG